MGGAFIYSDPPEDTILGQPSTPSFNLTYCF